MAYQHYITRKRAKLNGIGGAFNIPYGTSVEVWGNTMTLNGKAICYAESKTSHDYFCQNDDGNGILRGKLVQSIEDVLFIDLRQIDAKKRKRHDDAWEKVWDDPVCQKYKRKDHDEVWRWNHEFYNAEIADLRHIAALIGAKEVK